jgi:hypothetical protein
MSLLEGAAERRDLWSVSSLPEAVALYGFALTDRIPRREQVTIFQDIARSIAAKKEELVIAGQYSSIKELDVRLQSLRTAFQQLQLQDVAADSAKQQALYTDARGKILQLTAAHIDEDEAEIDDYCCEREEELAHTHMIQRENLALKLSWQPPQRVKHSGKFLELQQVI